MINIKGEMIVKKFKEGTDPRQICRICGFKDIKELGEYMKKIGYIWDPKEDNYKKVQYIAHEESLILSWEIENGTLNDDKYNIDIENIDFKKYLPILEVLYEKQNILYKMLENSEIDSYNLEGINIRRTVTINDLLNTLVEEFGTEKKLKFQEIMEEALIDYLRSRGYENKVKALFINYKNYK